MTVGHLDVLGRVLEVVVECFRRRRRITIAGDGWKLYFEYVDSYIAVGCVLVVVDTYVTWWWSGEILEVVWMMS